MNQKPKKSYGGIIFLFILVVVVAFYFNSKNNVKIKQDNDAVGVTVQMYKESIELREGLGDNTPYPDIFLYTELLKKQKNYTDEEAADMAAERYTEAEAFKWYAQENNIAPSEEEIDSHINTLIEKAKKADNYKEMNAKCEEEGIAFNDIYLKNRSFYGSELYTSNVYDYWKANYDKAHEGENSILNKFNMEWKDFVKQVVEDYQKTDDYSSKAKAIRNCKKVYIDNSTIEDMKKAEIFF